ncbi:SBBP repeat-containing protein [Paraflavisolibacter sp. H34]|uniref:SBBP repeat-containing protein n=1 Tax=Huijunlia imazamoxiresistens TaxID=3127457 RepID=UPI0030184F33
MVKNRTFRKPLLVAALLFLSVFSFGQVTLEKIKRHNGDPNSSDVPGALAVDRDGNVSVTGLSYDANSDYATVQYNSSGSVKWTKRYNGPGNGTDAATAVALDGSGNVYVTGTSAGSGTADDIATIKYSSTGSQLWVQRYNGPASGVDGATAIAVDAGGNVYVTGASEGSGTGGDYVTIKYDKNGAQLWVARYNGPGNGSDGANALAVDGSGNVYVTGQSTGLGTFGDIATLKYSAAGAELWAKRYNGPVSRLDRGTAIAVDGSGNVLVTGRVVTVLNEDGDFTDYITLKYTAAGVQQWAVQYNGDQSEEAYDLAVDGSGNVYITGRSGPVTEDPNYDIATIKYNASGVQQWARRYDGPGGDQGGGGEDLLLDASGNVYVTGTNSISGDFNDLDFVTVKYSSGGTQQWVAILDGPGNNVDAAHAIGIDGSGNLYVTGRSFLTQYTSRHTTTPCDYATVKYNASGAQQWVKRYNGPGLQNAGLLDEAAALVADNSGNVFVTGGSTRNETGQDFCTIKYDDDGNRLWTKWYNGTGNGIDIPAAMVRDASGNIYITGRSDGGTGPVNMDFATIKYDASGNQKWVKRYNGPGNDYDGATALAVDGSGNVYVTGTSLGGADFQSGDYATIKYDASGNQKWVKRYNGTGNSYDRAMAIAVDGSGNVYVTGGSPGAGSLDDYATVKYDASGNQKWAVRYNGPGNSTDEARSLAVDGSGNVYLTGSSWSSANTDYATIKYNTNGGQVWIARYNGPSNGFDVANKLLLDASGNVYVTGGSQGIGTGDDYATIKYSNSGAQLWAARYNAAASTDVANNMALDAAGNVYVTGQSYVDDPTYYDYATVKYNAAGVPQWVQRYSGTVPLSTDLPCGIAVNSSGTVFVTGTSTGAGTDDDFLTLIYSQASAKSEAITVVAEEQEGQRAAAGILRVAPFPNPVSATARIRYELPFAGKVSLKVYDLAGREVAGLVQATLPAGSYHTGFDASSLQKGTYYYRLTLRSEKGVFSRSGNITVIR